MRPSARRIPTRMQQNENSRFKTIARIIFQFSWVVLLASILFWIWVKLYDSDTFPIETVKVEGQYNHINHQDLQEMVLPFVQHGFFSINLNALHAQLMSMPWVASVDLRRVWPGTLVIKLVEQHAVARWNENSLLNSQAIVFTPEPKTIPDGLPDLDGPEGLQKQVLEQYEEVSQLFAPLQLRVLKLTMSERRAWRMELSNDTVIMLGREHLMARLKRFVQVYPKIFDVPERHAQYVDLRYTNGLAVQWAAKEQPVVKK